jgi:hypothetical protein
MRIFLTLLIALATAASGCNSNDQAPTPEDVQNTPTLQAPAEGGGQTMSSSKATN